MTMGFGGGSSPYSGAEVRWWACASVGSATRLEKENSCAGVRVGQVCSD